MRVELRSFLQSASGPYGGRANHLKLTTQKDGTILITHRKTAMTGDKVYTSHAWTRLNWIAVDVYWRGLPQAVRAEWGKCSRRTTDTVKSNLDEFRATNMPRAIYGFPLLRLPPDRFLSHACYVDRPTKGRPPLQLWTDGMMKPEPPPLPGDPPVPPGDPAQPFDLFEASEPNPFLFDVSCTWTPCPSSYDHCYDRHTAHPEVPFETQGPNTFLEWFNATEGDPPHRLDRWVPIRDIHSKAIWYGDIPRETVEAFDIRCRTGDWEGHEIPWPGAWCCQIKYESPPGVRLSYGYYWRSLVAIRPDGKWELAWKNDVWGTFPWPDQLELWPAGTILSDDVVCHDMDSIVYAGTPYHAHWADWTQDLNWAGITWHVTDPRVLSWDNELSGGEAFLNATDITCCDSGDRKGNWWFKLSVDHLGEIFVLEFRKPSTYNNPGWTGVYMIHDPTGYVPWAGPCMIVQRGSRDWAHEHATRWQIIVRELVKLIVCELVGWLFVSWWARFTVKWGHKIPYSFDLIHESIRHARPAVGAGVPAMWKCSVSAKLGPGAYSNYQIALEAVRRMRLVPGL